LTAGKDRKGGTFMVKSKFMAFGMLVLLLTIVVGTIYAYGGAQRIREILYQCEQELGVSFTINNNEYDTRTPRKQAELMVDMSQQQRINLYKNANYVLEMNHWENNNSEKSRFEKINYFEKLIREALERDQKVSAHLRGDAVDISHPRNRQSEIEQWLNKHGVKVFNETNVGIACWHLELK
jgi:hypothetical protein